MDVDGSIWKLEDSYAVLKPVKPQIFSEALLFTPRHTEVETVYGRIDHNHLNIAVLMLSNDTHQEFIELS